MNFEQLHQFITIVDKETYSEAADTLNISQSSLSKSIQRLEYELGVVLFNRSKRRISLTNEGEIFYKEATKLYADYNNMINRLNKHQEVIQIASLPFVNQYHILKTLRDFSTSSGIQFHLIELEEDEILKTLDKGVDIVIVRKAIVDEKLYTTIPYTEDELVAIINTENPFAKHKSLSIVDLRQEPCILMHKNTSIYKTCMDMFAANNITPNIIRTARIDSIISGVQGNEGVSYLMRKSLEPFILNDIKIVKLKENIESEICFAYKKSNRKVAMLNDFLNKRRTYGN
ncbi:LysR family transcriptional regulator [Breznakia pachnodae]|uniref:DNA-binding transcriptional LysR family regulator n=1 Tax=Breznakia pachnodae TaxID=265178 RepID=A0ABU0E102_9FIRM|nr:LysR family transcriptional regulator [Breznakia pachnodae]MDQ0360567.1 DNA-binding transcriptional LysR family regulator [Breznakia pachnodae]